MSRESWIPVIDLRGIIHLWDTSDLHLYEVDPASLERLGFRRLTDEEKIRHGFPGERRYRDQTVIKTLIHASRRPQRR